ncbi:GntP family permease [Lachnospiraceae bacterium NSJ-143]|nr:GntP family permease [Lachnospiraceae bacterium NSJ-143]
MLLAIFLIGIILLMLLIIKFKVNPFLALLFISVLIGFGTLMNPKDISANIASGFGNTMTSIGIVIALGIILGQLLYETGGTEEIANLVLKKVGMKNSPLALAITGVIVAIPVYFDAAFVILITIAKQLSKKTGIPLARFVTALAVGLIVGHCVIIPTPGPMAVCGNVNASVASFVFYGLIVGFIAALVGGVLFSRLTVKSFFPEQCGMEAEEVSMEESKPGERASGVLAIGLILLPIALILIGTVVSTIVGDSNPALTAACSFIGDKNIALFIGVVVAIFALKKYFKRPLDDILTEAAGQAGMVLLITGAGGSFGAIINATGIGEYIVNMMSNFNVPLIILGFVLSQILRAAQGSATVALVTTSAIVAPSISSMGASPVLVGLAICFGSVGLSLPNDSGFWVINRFSGFTFPETIKGWTLTGFVSGLTGLVVVLILSMFTGVLPGLM